MLRSVAHFGARVALGVIRKWLVTFTGAHTFLQDAQIRNDCCFSARPFISTITASKRKRRGENIVAERPETGIITVWRSHCNDFEFETHETRRETVVNMCIDRSRTLKQFIELALMNSFPIASIWAIVRAEGLPFDGAELVGNGIQFQTTSLNSLIRSQSNLAVSPWCRPVRGTFIERQEQSRIGEENCSITFQFVIKCVGNICNGRR